MKKRVLALTLAVVFVFSCIGTSVFAATENTVKQYGKEGNYVAFGDSVTRGCGAQGDNMDNYYNLSNRVVEGSYPTTIARAVGCEINEDAGDDTKNTFYPVCSPGQTLTFTMDLLGIDHGGHAEVDNYPDEDGNYSRYGYYWKYHEDMEEYYAKSADYCKNAGLITINLGMADVFFGAKELAAKEMDSYDVSAGFAAAYIKYTYSQYQVWKENYPKLLDWLDKNTKPGTKIVVTGVSNPMSHLTITDDTLIPVGDAQTAVSALMNQNLKAWAEQYDKTVYVDFSNVETRIVKEDMAFTSDAFNKNQNLATHPTEEGHAYMARQILAVLDEKPTPQEVSTDISLDVGNTIQQIVFIMVDNKVIPWSDYQQDGCHLKIDYNCSNANVLMLYALDINSKKIQFHTYHLVFDENKGYVAYRMYTSNDALNTVAKPLRLMKKGFDLLFKQ